MRVSLKNKKIAVIGLGRSGFAAAKFLNGEKARVCVTEGSEKKEALENASYLRTLGIEVETGAHTEAFLAGSDLVVTSPGVPKQSLPLRWAKEKNIPVISEVELASYFCRGRVVAVTGSNGKTTTCNLIYRVLKEAGRDCVLCGNVGYSFLDALPAISRKTLVVLELSSFQLEDSPKFRPSMAVVLNISANHLDRHGTLENYALAKENIFRNQGRKDILVLNAGDERVKAMASKAPSRVIFYGRQELTEGICPDGARVVWKKGGKKKELLDTRSLHLKGGHNLENLMACAVVTTLLRVPRKKIQATLENFKTLEHRIEPVGELGGVKFVNDAKSTTVESTRMALLAVEGPVILVAGGRDKGLSYGELEPVLLERVKFAVLYGEARDKIGDSWKKFTPVQKEANFRQAVRLAFGHAKPGDTLLLSPMGTSFDQFSSFEQRGEAFKHLFHELAKEKGPTGP